MKFKIVGVWAFDYMVAFKEKNCDQNYFFDYEVILMWSAEETILITVLEEVEGLSAPKKIYKKAFFIMFESSLSGIFLMCSSDFPLLQIGLL